MIGLLASFAARPKLLAGLAVLLIALGLIGSVYLSGIHRGAQGERDDNARQDQRAQGEAFGFWHQVEQCAEAGGRWDQTIGECDMGDAL